MATVAQNISTILDQAAILDGLVTQFRSAKALIELAESEIRKAQPGANHEVFAGRIRLAAYAHGRMTDDGMFAGKTVAQMASAAWSGVS